MVRISRTLPLGSTPETVSVCSKGILNISSIVFAAAMAKCIAEEKWSKIRCKNCPVKLIRKFNTYHLSCYLELCCIGVKHKLAALLQLLNLLYVHSNCRCKFVLPVCLRLYAY